MRSIIVVFYFLLLFLFLNEDGGVFGRRALGVVARGVVARGVVGDMLARSARKF